MPLDPQIAAILETLNVTASIDLSTVSPAVMRQMFEQLDEARVEGEPVAEVAERTIPGPAGDLTVRIYTPFGNGPFPVLTYFHGGGFVLCSLDSHDSICRVLTSAANFPVFPVNDITRFESSFPAAIVSAREVLYSAMASILGVVSSA